MNNLDKAKQLYQGKKILILGLGLNHGGVGAAKFFAEVGAEVKVTDLKSKQDLQESVDLLDSYKSITYSLGEHQLPDINWADIIVRNPAIQPDNPYLQHALDQKKLVVMELDVFFQFASPQQIIGITGTKGKTTTASLIFEVLKNNQNVILAGNLGKSMFDLIPIIDDKSLIILELSSFQLQALQVLKVSLHISIITNIFPDHLNYHKNMAEYIQIKRLIAKFQTGEDVIILNQDDPDLTSKQFLDGLLGKQIFFSNNDLPNNFHPLLPGEHNRANFAAALAVAKIFNMDTDQALSIMSQFKGAEFRLQLVKEINNIKVYNDSAATNPGATIEALKSLPDSILICGGMNKKLDYQELADLIIENAKSVYLLEGDASQDLKSQISNLKSDLIKGTYDNLDNLLTDVFQEAKSGETILFSPGATSFNLFQNEFDRGRKFNQALEKVMAKMAR